jgi:TonB family protein
MATASNQKILRVGVIQAGKIVEERLFKRREDVTVGKEARSTIVVPGSELPPSLAVFEHRNGQYQLVFTEAMQGRVRVGDQDVDFAGLRTQKLAQQRGSVWVYPLNEIARGKVTLGEVTLLFQFVAPPPEPARAELPPSIRGSVLAGMDKVFMAVLGTSLLLHFTGATCIIFSPMPQEPELTLEELPDRFAKLIIPQKLEEPKPVEVTDTGVEQKEEAKAEGPKKEDTRPATPKSRDEIAKSVQSKGLLKVLGSSGSGAGAFADVLGSGTGSADIAQALAGAGGVGIATEASLGATGPRGGGSGTVAGIGDLGTSGGGNVDLGQKREVAISGRVKDSAPELDSADVNRDELARYVKARLKAIIGCYERELKRNPSLKGRVVVRFSITPAGRASGVEIEENSLGNEAVGACIRTIVRAWVFPFKPPDEVTVSYPFLFSPAS